MSESKEKQCGAVSAPEQTDEIVIVRDLCKHFPIKTDVFGHVLASVKAVNDVSFTIKKGTTLGVVGESGCGKTTMGRTMLRLYDITSGEVIYKGLSIQKLTDAHVTENAYVCAHIPASAGAEDKPALGLIAHLDTTEVAPGAGVKPHIVHYEGGDLVCGIVDGKPVSMSTAKLPALNDLVGEDLVCTDGTTLLGADDKAGDYLR